MTLLAAGLALFLAIHLIPSLPRLRAALVGKLGEKPYRGVFSVVAFLSLAAIVWGFSRAPQDLVYMSPDWGHLAALFLVPLALMLFAAANMPTRIRSTVRHPMLLGVLLWAVAHLLANGEARAIVLFGGFALFAAILTISAAARGKGPPIQPAPRMTMDIIAVIAGLVAAALLAGVHGVLFGAPLI